MNWNCTNRLPTASAICIILIFGLARPSLAQSGDLGNAIYERDMELVRRLIATGLDLDADMQGYGLTPLQQAINDDWAEVIPVLVAAGANPDLAERRGTTPLMEAVSGQRLQSFRALLDAGADVNPVDSRGRSALDIAYDRGSKELIRALVEGGANTDRGGPDANPILLRAVQDEDLELVKLLLAGGASPDVADVLGNTPLIVAAMKNETEMVRTLLDAGADPNATSATGWNAHQAAEMVGATDAAAMLEAAGANTEGQRARNSEEVNEALRENMRRANEERREEKEVRKPEADEIEGPGTYPTGWYTGPCSAAADDAPPTNTKDGDTGFLMFTVTGFYFGKVTEQEILDSPVLGDMLREMRGGTMTSGMDLISVMTVWGGQDIVSPPDCMPVNLGPGEYTQIVHSGESRWVWKEPEGGCRPGVYCSVRKETLPGFPKVERSYSYFNVGAVAPVAEEEEDCELVELVKPTDPDWGSEIAGQAVVFDLKVAKDAQDTAALVDLFVESPKSVDMLSPSDIPVELTWRLPAFRGTSASVQKLDDYWSRIQYRYDIDEMPTDNSDWHEAEAEIEVRALRECLKPQPWNGTIAFLFARDGRGNPDGSVPNWYYYWMQSSASQGLRPLEQVKYGAQCDGGDTQGFFNGIDDADRITVCDGAQESRLNPVSGRTTLGIDNFAATVVHEWKHKTNWESFGWRRFFDECPSCEFYGPEWLARDADRDWVPDDVEEELGYGLKVGNPDTHNIKMKNADEHYITYKEEEKWTLGRADREDWAYPGKRAGGG